MAMCKDGIAAGDSKVSEVVDCHYKSVHPDPELGDSAIKHG